MQSVAFAIWHRLPKDVRDMIAAYLPLRNIESEANFIHRTEIKSHNVSDYHRDAQQYRRPHGCFSAHSPDNLKKVFLDQSDAPSRSLAAKGSKVVVSDTVPKKDSARISLDTIAASIDAEKYYYQTIDVAISSDGQWFGRLAQKKIVNVLRPDEDFLNIAQITVIHIPTNAKRDFAIPMFLKSIIFLDFNKQGTKIITHGVCHEKEEPISFMYNVVSEKEHEAKSKKTLADYLKQRGICNKLANSLQ